MENNLFQFPITGWEIKSEPIDGLLSVRFPFLSHGQQDLAEADPGRPYTMQAEQARELRDALSRALEHIENHVREPSSSPLSPSSLSIY
jgi:BssS protein family